MKRLFAALLLASVAYDASVAGPIYRCGRQYSQIPCPDGQLLDVSDPRSGAQRAEAKRVAEQERKQAAEMKREREEQAASAPSASASGFNGRSPAPQASAASAPKHRKKQAKPKSTKTSDFVAVEPKGSAKASQK